MKKIYDSDRSVGAELALERRYYGRAEWLIEVINTHITKPAGVEGGEVE